MSISTRLQADSGNYAELGNMSAIIKHTENAHECDLYFDDQLLALRHESTAVVSCGPAGIDMFQPMAMHAKQITGLAAGTANGHALRYEQVVGQYLPTSTKLNGLVAPDGDVDINSYNLINVLDPTADQQAATKHYVDAQITSALAPIPQFIQLISNGGTTPGSINSVYVFGANNRNSGSDVTYDLTTGVITIGADGLYKFAMQLNVKYASSLGNAYYMNLTADPTGSPGTGVAQTNCYVPQAANFIGQVDCGYREFILACSNGDSFGFVNKGSVSDGPEIQADSMVIIQKL